VLLHAATRTSSCQERADAYTHAYSTDAYVHAYSTDSYIHAYSIDAYIHAFSTEAYSTDAYIHAHSTDAYIHAHSTDADTRAMSLLVSTCEKLCLFMSLMGLLPTLCRRPNPDPLMPLTSGLGPNKVDPGGMLGVQEGLGSGLAVSPNLKSWPVCIVSTGAANICNIQIHNIFTKGQKEQHACSIAVNARVRMR